MTRSDTPMGVQMRGIWEEGSLQMACIGLLGRRFSRDRSSGAVPDKANDFDCFWAGKLDHTFGWVVQDSV